MSGPKGELLPIPEPSPTPSEIEEDLACFSPSPPNLVAEIQHKITEAIAPPPTQINGMITLCHAILWYQQSHPELSEAMKEWTDQLMVPIQAISEHSIDLPLPITLSEYNAITHLTYITAFTDHIEPYIDGQTLEPPPTLLQCITTPSHISVSSDSEDDETDHPGGEWMLYNSSNPKHYALVFINKQNG
jgi:hypothetical protein